MPDRLDPELTDLRERAKSFAASIDANAERAEVRQAAQVAGFYAMTQPRAFGGAQASVLALTVVRDELAAQLLPHQSSVFGPGPGLLAQVEEPLRSSRFWVAQPS